VSVRHFLEVDDLSADELAAVLDLAEQTAPPQVLARRGVALVFEKPSLRTRNSTEMAVFELGGHPVTMHDDEVGLGRRESAADIARVLSGYHAAICARVFEHEKLEQLAAMSSVPVVNLLSDRSHPCQALADLLTLRQHYGKLEGLELAYVGDYNNVARSLAIGAALTGAHVRLGCPAGFSPDDAEVERLAVLGAPPVVTTRPAEAVDGADAVYTDVWTSMGQEDEAAARQQAFEGFIVDERLMAGAASHAVFLHCLPAHRGEEVAGAVVDGPQSLAFPQAHNRLHAVRGLFLFLLGAGSAID
jgi:ornithine carbamoyltransferase